MIVILCDGLAPKPDEQAGAIEFSPEFDLLNEPYLDRLAKQYRRYGAREVIWTGSATDGALRLAFDDADPWQPLDIESLNNGAVKPGETLLIADIRLWPDDETGEIVRRYNRFPSALTTFTLTSDQDSYSEVIEASNTSAVCTVTRRYQQTMTEQRASCPVALMARGDARGAICRNLLWAVVSGDQESVAVLASIADHEALKNPTWIETEADYLQVTRRLLSEGEAPDPSARPIGDRVWAMPGAVIDPNCSLIGPVLLGRGCHVGRGTRIVGPTVVGESAEIGEDCFVRESVLMNGAVLPGGSRTWRSVVRAGEILEEGRPRPFGWLGNESGLQRLGAISRLRFSSVVVPGRRALNKHKHLLHRAAKRALDICGALVGLMLTLPMYPFIAIAVKLSSRGPVFYTHRRQTLGGKEFACLKFRTMISDADKMQQDLRNEVDGPQFHMEADPRLTRVGCFLRKTNLDEVPQFWNVLLGHMSLVGPRPSPDKENQYCPAWREARLSVRPGLTGMWQVRRSSDRSAGDFHEWIHYDIQYLQEWSLWTDLKLIGATVWQIAGRAKEVLKRCVPPFN
ncbi:MAG: sugar transferase [Planctomycetes bacterium]|nr:sugar transferase [Planctomycetota bacterium]